MASILNNVSALGASRQIALSLTGLEKVITRLTTGRRINRASDDAAGLGIANNLGADIRVASQGKRNANDAISYLQVADGVLDEITSLITRAAELTEQAKTGTISTTNRRYLDSEFQNIKESIADLGEKTVFNGASIFSNRTTTVAVASFSPTYFTIGTISSSSNDALGMVSSDSLTTVEAANDVSQKLYIALESVSSLRATMGASMQQMTAISNSLGIQMENFTAAYSQIRDANIADEVISLTKFQILNQSGTSALSQANNAQQQILALLR